MVTGTTVSCQRVRIKISHVILTSRLSYNQSIAVATGTVSPTVFTEGYSFVANTSTPGRVTIAAIGSTCQNLYGAGTLFKVGFDVVGITGQTTPLDFVTGLTATVLYADDDLVTPVPLTLQSGSLTARTAYVTGDVNGDTVVNVADAALALQIASGTHTPTWDQAGACDVNGDATCDSADASLLLCYVAFGSWESCGTPTANLAARAVDLAAASVVTVSLGAPNGGPGQTITVPVMLAGGSEFAGGTFSFQYDPTRMTFVSSAKTSLTTAFSVRSHTQWPGLVRIAMASGTAVGGDGAILNLRFQLTGAPAPIGLAQYWLNDSSGRDFQTSALQKTIVVVATAPHNLYKLFLPTVVR